MSTPVYIDGADGAIFGLLTEPNGPANGLSLLVFSGGGRIPSMHRNGMWRRLAERAAESGFRVLQVDWHGVGESGGHVDSFDIGAPFTEDVLAAYGWLHERGGDHVVTTATCFGARSVLAAANQMPALRGMAMVAVPIVDAAAQRHTSNSIGWYTRQAVSTRVLRGFFDPRRRTAYVRILRAKMGSLAARGDSRPMSRGFFDGVRNALEREVAVLVAHGRDDDYYTQVEDALTGALGNLFQAQAELVTQVTLPGEVHGFASLKAQDDTVATVTTWLDALASRVSA